MSNSKPISAREAAARTAKASKMANVLIAHKADVATVAALPEEGRRIVAELAGCRMPSPRTWELVADMVAADALFAPTVAAVA